MGAIFTFITWAYSLIRGKQVQIATTENKPAVSPMKAATTLSWSAILLNGATRLGPSMSMVYRNSLSVLGIGDVAIKVASTKDLVRGLRQEKAILVALQGVEGVPEVLGSFKDENERAYYLLIKWIEGWTLDEMLGVKSLSMLEGLEVIKRVAVVVRSVHERNVIHRDIKPGNIIVGFNNEVTLIDFNLGLYCCEELSNTDRMGTPLFCAPEQRIQYAALSRATDIYGLGQTINMMLQRITLRQKRVASLHAFA